MLGYESVNFLEGLGSIGIFAFLQFLTIIVAFFLRVLSIKCPCKWGQKTFSSSAVWSSTLTFVHGTFFEILVCVSISMSMVRFWDFYKSADHTSISISIVFLILLAAYLGFVAYFAVYKSHQMATLNQVEVQERHIKRSKVSTHKELIDQARFKGRSTIDLEHHQKFLSEQNLHRLELIEKGQKVNGQQFDLYKPLVDELRTDRCGALLSNSLINTRRLILLFMAMFVHDL